MKNPRFASSLLLFSFVVAACSDRDPVDTVKPTPSKPPSQVDSQPPRIEKPTSSVESGPAGAYQLDTEFLNRQVDAMLAKVPAGRSIPLVTVGLQQMRERTDSLVLNADHTVTYERTTGGQTDRRTGTWKLEGDQLSIETKDEAGAVTMMTGTFKDGVIACPEQGGEMALSFKRK